MARTDRFRKWFGALTATLAVTAVVAFLASRVIGVVFQQKLVKAVNQKLHAQLIVGSVLYRPPFTFYGRDLRLIAPGRDGGADRIISAAGVELKLGRLPRHGRPATIDKLILRQVAVRSGDGAVSIPVDRFEMSLRTRRDSQNYDWHASLADGAASHGQAGGQFDPVAKRIQVTRLSLRIQVASALQSAFQSEGRNSSLDSLAPAGEISVNGSGSMPLERPAEADYRFVIELKDGAANVEYLKARLKEGDARIVINPGAAPAGTPLVEASIDHLRASANEGQIRIDGGTAIISPHDKDWHLSQVIGRVQLGRELPLFLPRSGWFFNRGEFRGPVRFTLAASGPLRIHEGESPLEAIHHELLAYPRDVSIRPRNFSQPIEHVTGGPIAFRGGVVTFQNLSGVYGQDQLLLRQARLTLENPVRRISLEDLRSQVKFEEINGVAIFNEPTPPYPGVIGKTVAQLRPRGPFVVGGGSWYAINRPPGLEPWVQFKPDFFIRLMGDGGSFAVSNYRVPLSNIQGEATIAPLTVDIRRFDADTMGGRAWASGRIAPGKPFLYRGEVDFRGLDLARLARTLSLDGAARQRLSGIGAANLKVSGSSNGAGHTASQTLVVDGECEVIRGDFWSVPTVHEVATRVRGQKELGTADAAAVVHIEREKVTLQRAAINSPFLGLLGSGTIGFDKSVDLTVVAAPLGDWRDKMRQAGIPIIGDVLGAVQEVINAAKGTLFYQFRVTGSLKNPVETIVPAPILTQPGASLFGQMLQQDQNEKLLENVRKHTPPLQAEPPQAQPAAVKQSGKRGQ